ncbi:hypothetical protein [Geomonas agri]|uniref:hypothetical protein n=1 Tax=Geomonas agri TaxID=2873702 RepID=UPI001CD1E2B0|nr:hypothetical protein [Geomonas agri]
MSKIVNLEERRKPADQPVTNELLYHMACIDAIVALQGGNHDKAQATLFGMLDDLETAMAGGEL